MDTVLLHTCCAPCSLSCIDPLRAEGIEPVAFWYTPNIHPWKEYQARRDCLLEYAPTIGMEVCVQEDYGLKDFVRHAHSRRAGNRQISLSPGDILLRHPAQKLLGFFQDMAEMPLVCTVNDMVRAVQHHAFDGGGPHVKSYFQRTFLLAGKRLRY